MVHYQTMSRLTIVALSVIIGISLIFSDVTAKKYTRCGLVRLLNELAFERSFIGHWVCLIESESGKNTSKVTTRANYRQGLGLFQILSRDWCTFHRRGALCNVRCEDMVDDYLIDDAQCAKKVMRELGFKVWNGWTRNCKKRMPPLPIC